jgi:hypothetical protein
MQLLEYLCARNIAWILTSSTCYISLVDAFCSFAVLRKCCYIGMLSLSTTSKPFSQASCYIGMLNLYLDILSF